MRISRKKLINIARHEAEGRGAAGEVVSGYLVGSVAAGDALFGGAADIDLVLIHNGRPEVRREVVPLSPEIHLDITHHAKGLYRWPRKLRVHPWLGPSMCEPIFLYDPEHFFEWAQAGARGQYHRADHVHERAQAFLVRARALKANLNRHDGWLYGYLRSVMEGANAITCLAGFPAAGRRIALTISQRTNAAQHPEVYQDFNHLLGADALDRLDLSTILTVWSQVFAKAGDFSDDPRLHACRHDYYLRAFQELVNAGSPQAILWPFLYNLSISTNALESAGLPSLDEPRLAEILERLQLNDEHHNQRESSLEDYLDHIEGILHARVGEFGV